MVGPPFPGLWGRVWYCFHKPSYKQLQTLNSLVLRAVDLIPPRPLLMARERLSLLCSRGLLPLLLCFLLLCTCHYQL